MRRVLAAIVAVAALAAGGAAQAQSAAYRFQHSDDPVRDRGAYLLTLIEADPAAQKALAASAPLQAIGQRLTAERAALLTGCRQTKACPVARLMLSDAEIGQVGEALGALAAPGGPLNGLVERQMRPSGAFQKYAGLDDAGLMRAAWAETAAGVNRLFRVYAQGEAPRYAEIDSMIRDPASDAFRHLLVEAMDAETDAPGPAFFTPWSALGFDLLGLNQRDEAARYEPLETGANAAAYGKARGLDWKRFRYTAVVVPGAGTDAIETGLSSVGALRVRLAVRRWRQGLAPFLIVSGGHVHPNRTPFAEAVEMKRELMVRYGVPEAAIVIDPYARHTTTNLRNAVRLLFRMGAPAERPMLIVTSQDQSRYIEAKVFADRGQSELGYQPVSVGERLSPFDLAARPNLVSLHADLADPLDP